MAPVDVRQVNVNVLGLHKISLVAYVLRIHYVTQ